MSVEVAIEALEKDAVKWEDSADALSKASSQAATQDLSDYEFSFIGTTVGLTSTYAEIQNKVANLCAGGYHEMTAIAAELRAVKTTYEGTDEAAKAKLQGTWDVA